MTCTDFMKVSVLSLVMLFTASAVAEERITEEAMEREPEVFFLGENLNGVIRGKVCQECPDVKLSITPKTRAYVDRKPVDLKDMVSTTSKPYLTFFDVKTKKVTRMFWRTN